MLRVLRGMRRSGHDKQVCRLSNTGSEIHMHALGLNSHVHSWWRFPCFPVSSGGRACCYYTSILPPSKPSHCGCLYGFCLFLTLKIVSSSTSGLQSSAQCLIYSFNKYLWEAIIYQVKIQILKKSFQDLKIIPYHIIYHIIYHDAINSLSYSGSPKKKVSNSI